MSTLHSHPYSRSYLFHFPVEETEVPVRRSQSSLSSLVWIYHEKEISVFVKKRNTLIFFFFPATESKGLGPQTRHKGET